MKFDYSIAPVGYRLHGELRLCLFDNSGQTSVLTLNLQIYLTRKCALVCCAGKHLLTQNSTPASVF